MANARRRRAGGGGGAAAAAAPPTAAAAAEEKVEEEQPKPAATPFEEAKKFVRNVILICIVIAGPYALFRGYMWTMLSSGWFRPVVELTDPRQVLIVGTQSSGTTATAQALNELGIEVAHETVDAQDAFARDGTVGWAQGIRYLASAETREARLNLDALCTRPLLRILHSTQFEQSTECSYRVEWDRCWQRECRSVFSRNFGCHPHCERPPFFGRVLLQVRDPMRAISSLLYKYCTDLNPGTLPHPLKLAALQGLLADVPWADMKYGCKEVFANYWLEYNQRVMDAFGDETSPAFAWFRVEDTSPCELANLTGVLEPILDGTDVTYEPTRARARKACAKFDAAAAEEDKKAQRQKNGELKAHGEVNSSNKGNVRLTWSDFDELPELKARMQAMARRFGYPDGTQEVAKAGK